MIEEEDMPAERHWPRAHWVEDDFFAPAALETIFREVAALEKRMKPGLVRDIGHDGQSVFFEHARRKNKAIWIHDPSKTLRAFRDTLWSPERLAAFDEAREPLFQIIGGCWSPNLQISSYLTGDHYDFHEDEGAGVNLTVIVFLAAEPKRVRGGDLVLAYDGEETTIPFRHNRLVIFPSKTLHCVTPVRVDSKDPRHARISLQSWLAYGRPPKSAKTARRPPEADRPTFLLAEPSIIAAAQAMVASAKAPDQTPEDLYWGAFYLSRILSANLRCLAAAQEGIKLGPVRIRRRDELEVHASAGKDMRLGFALAGPDTSPEKALRLFVTRGRDRKERVVPPEATEAETGTILRRLLTHRSGR